MRHSPRRWAMVLLGMLAAAMVMEARPAAAKKKRVVVLPFSGPRGRTAWKGVMQGMRRRVVAIPARKYSAAANRLGVNGRSPEGMVATCSKVKCDAVVTGKVSKRRRRFNVVVTVYNGGTGAALGRRAAGVRGARKVGRAGAAIGRRCLRLVAKGRFKRGGAPPPPAPEPPPPEPAPAPAPAPAPVAKADTSDIPVFKPSKPARQEDEEEEEEGRVSKRATHRSKWDSIFELSFSIGLAFRRYELEGTDPNIQPNKYEGGMYPEFTLHADIYPLTPFVKNALNGLGVGVGYTRHISISTKPKDTPETEVDTTSQELLLDLKWRWTILSRVTSPQATIFAGFGMRDFNLAENPTLTSFNYRFIRFGLDGAVPLGTPLVALTTGFDVRVLMQVGQEAVDAFGSKTGGLGYAIRAGAAGKYHLSTGAIAYFVNFEYLRFTTDFAGLEPGTVIRAGLPDRTDASSGVDRFIRLWLGLGYAY
jgi:hypothetical protein